MFSLHITTKDFQTQDTGCFPPHRCCYVTNLSYTKDANTKLLLCEHCYSFCPLLEDVLQNFARCAKTLHTSKHDTTLGNIT